MPAHGTSENRVFRAFELTPPADVRVVLLGQDPYPDRTNATGLAFSVPQVDSEGNVVTTPASLRRILACLGREPDYCPQPHGDLTSWTGNGLLLLNRILTIGNHPLSHQHCGWQAFTDKVVNALALDAVAKTRSLDIVLLGCTANKVTLSLQSPYLRVHRFSHPVASRCSLPMQLFSAKGERPFKGVHPFWKTTAAAQPLPS